MSLSKVLLVALFIAAANAKPLSPSKVVRAEAAAPSTFPLGDACGNEWKYLNFDPKNDAHKVHLQELYDVICISELRAISSWGQRPLRTARQPSTTGNSCSDEGTLAYTSKDEDGDQGEKIHFCDIAFDRPTSGPDINCGRLDKYPSTKMDTFSRVALHETLHYSTVGPPSKLGEQIVDQQNDDGVAAYDPERAHGLNDIEQDNQSEKAEANVDNYAWMALDAWISYNCSPEDHKQDAWNSYFPDDPPKYA
ncbi:hypothetical protein PT974_07610 [Cladobotryum mycophilum]|uniref:Lysine-specific metallo-endopeptidase domain-containing protein n=1 Tax=Cladobotryum mycophilum TaxID=491253 RepID=A0ABR0SPQ8_9HYPO